MIFDEVIKNISDENLKYLFFFKENQKIDEEIITYYFFISVTEQCRDIFLNTESMLNGSLKEIKYNKLLDEDSLLILFLKMSIFISKELNFLVPKEKYFNIFKKLFSKYQSIFDGLNTDLLDKNIDISKRNNLILDELWKNKICKINLSVLLSFYKYRCRDKEEIQEFINKLERLSEKFEELYLNTKNEDYWNYLISNI